MAPANTAQHDVVVVGAGLSGLVAARRLVADGLRVAVLEARTRVGGRMHSAITVDGSVVDLGGQWGGASHHRFAALLEELGLERFDILQDPGLGVLHCQGQRQEAPLAHTFADSLLYFDPAALALPAEALAAARRLQAAFAALVEQVNPRRPWLTPKAEWLDRLSVAAWAELHSGEPLARLPLEWLCRVGGSGSFEPWEASILHLAWTQAVAPQGETPEAWQVRGGAGAVARRLAHDLQQHAPDCITLDHPVQAIEQHPQGVVVVGAGGEMGSLEKVILRWESAFWETAACAWLHLGATRGDFPLIVDLSAHAGAPTLALLHGGARAREALDTLDDAALVADALAALGAALGVAVPVPLATRVTRWRSDPYSRGSFSFPALGQSFDDFDALAAPVADRVLFAGEATSRSAFGTVHGAVLSALREVGRLGIAADGVPGRS